MKDGGDKPSGQDDDRQRDRDEEERQRREADADSERRAEEARRGAEGSQWSHACTSGCSCHPSSTGGGSGDDPRKEAEREQETRLQEDTVREAQVAEFWGDLRRLGSATVGESDGSTSLTVAANEASLHRADQQSVGRAAEAEGLLRQLMFP